MPQKIQKNKGKRPQRISGAKKLRGGRPMEYRRGAKKQSKDNKIESPFLVKKDNNYNKEVVIGDGTIRKILGKWTARIVKELVERYGLSNDMNKNLKQEKKRSRFLERTLVISTFLLLRPYTWIL